MKIVISIVLGFIALLFLPFSGEKYLHFKDTELFSGEVIVDPRMSPVKNRSKMTGVIYVYVVKDGEILENCLVDAQLKFQVSDTTEMIDDCNTYDSTCYFNSGENYQKPRMLLRVRDAEIEQLNLNLSIESSEQDGHCFTQETELTIIPKWKRHSIWSSLFTR